MTKKQTILTKTTLAAAVEYVIDQINDGWQLVTVAQADPKAKWLDVLIKGDEREELEQRLGFNVSGTMQINGFIRTRHITLTAQTYTYTSRIQSSKQ